MFVLYKSHSSRSSSRDRGKISLFSRSFDNQVKREIPEGTHQNNISITTRILSRYRAKTAIDYSHVLVERSDSRGRERENFTNEPDRRCSNPWRKGEGREIVIITADRFTSYQVVSSQSVLVNKYWSCFSARTWKMWINFLWERGIWENLLFFNCINLWYTWQETSLLNSHCECSVIMWGDIHNIYIIL